jgi:hypothetical protein
MPDTHRGAKVGHRLTAHIVRAIVATHKGLLSTKHKLAMLVFRSISDEISAEVDHTIGHIFKNMAESPDSHDSMANLLKFMAYDHGQLKALAGSSLVSQSLLWPISQILNNVLAPVVYTAVANDPRTILDPGTMASLAATGRFDVGEALADIRKQGFDTPFGEPLIDASRTYPDISQSTDLLNRGQIDAQQFDAWALKAGIPGDVAVKLRQLAIQPVSPADAALGLLRGNIGRSEAIGIASEWGLTESSFDLLLNNTGEPPGTEQLLEAFRRGFIDEAKLTRGILESRVRNEWIPTLIKLRYSPMSVADAVNAHVQNHLDAQTMSSIAEQNGLIPGAVDILAQTAGEPLSRTEMEQLYNRGLVTANQVKQALAESRLKNKYADLALALHRKLLEPRMLSSAVEFGSISHESAIRHAMESGFSKEDAVILVDEGSHRKLHAYRQRIVASVESLYESNAISRNDAKEVMARNGFEGTEADLILQAAEYRREQRIVSTTLAVIRSKYVGHHIDEKSAKAYIDAIGVPTAQRDYELGLWSIERAANVRNLTEAQIVKAVKKQLIKPEDALKRLEHMGYLTDDAVLLLKEI